MHRCLTVEAGSKAEEGCSQLGRPVFEVTRTQNSAKLLTKGSIMALR